MSNSHPCIIVISHIVCFNFNLIIKKCLLKIPFLLLHKLYPFTLYFFILKITNFATSNIHKISNNS